MGIGLSIVFTGLCALVTDADGGSAQVLLVDAQGIGEVGGVVLPEHAPTLVVALDGLANAETSRPTRVVMAGPAAGSIDAADGRALAGQVGLWDLTGSEVRIRVQRGAESGLRVFRSDGASCRGRSRPATGTTRMRGATSGLLPTWGRSRATGASTPRWSLDRQRKSKGPFLVPSRRGSFSIPGSSKRRPRVEKPADRDDAFEFRDKSGAPRLRQALTDTIRWSLATDAGTVLIEIVPATGGEVKRLVFSPRATTPTVFISNMPAQNAAIATHHAVSDEEMAALHFGAYYKLLRNEPAQPAVAACLASGFRADGCRNGGPDVLPSGRLHARLVADT